MGGLNNPIYKHFKMSTESTKFLTQSNRTLWLIVALDYIYACVKYW